MNDQPPPTDYVGHHFYWLSTLDGGSLIALFNKTPLRSLAQSLVAPGTIEVAFDQVQVALNIPPFSHRPGAITWMVNWRASRTPLRSQCLRVCLCRNNALKTLEIYGCGPEPIGLMELFFETKVQKHSSNPKDIQRLNCQSRVKFCVDLAMFYWRYMWGTISAAIMRLKRATGRVRSITEGGSRAPVAGMLVR